MREEGETGETGEMRAETTGQINIGKERERARIYFRSGFSADASRTLPLNICGELL